MKKDWSEMRDSRAREMGEEGVMKERRRGRLLTWAREERSWLPRVLRSSGVRIFGSIGGGGVFGWCCLRFLEGVEAMDEKGAAAEERRRRRRNGGGGGGGGVGFIREAER